MIICVKYGIIIVSFVYGFMRIHAQLHTFLLIHQGGIRYMKTKRRFTAVLLIFSMVLSLFSGMIYNTDETQAASDNKIILGTPVRDGSAYTYPDVKIELKDNTKKLYQFNAVVDSGYMMVTSTKLGSTTGQGIAYTTGKATSLTVDDLEVGKKYTMVSFDMSNVYEGTTKTQIEEFLAGIKFVPEDGEEQVLTASICGGVYQLCADLNGKRLPVKFFNGHFYGFTGDAGAGHYWKDAYNNSYNALLGETHGYLCTVTTKEEDRFIWANWNDNGKSRPGWIGAARVTAKKSSMYNTGSGTFDSDSLEWNDLPDFDTEEVTNNKWYWLSGPEAGEDFGYQDDSLGWSGGTNPSDEGHFVTKAGYYSNWNTQTDNVSPKEPNGGFNTEFENLNAKEGYAYFGETAGGNWNDNFENNWRNYYVEFGDGTDSYKSNDGEEVIAITVVAGSGDATPAPTVAPTATPKATVKPTATPKTTVKPTVTPKANASATPDANATATPDANATATPDADATATPDANATATPDADATATPDTEATATPDANATASPAASSIPDSERTKIVTAYLFQSEFHVGEEVAVIRIIDENDQVVQPFDTEGNQNVAYQWQTKDENGEWVDIVGNDYIYMTATGNEKIVRCKVTGVDKYKGTIYTDAINLVEAQPTVNPDKKGISGTATIVNEAPGFENVGVGTKLTADTSNIGPEGASLTYQWYKVDADGLKTPIENEIYKNYILTADDFDEDGKPNSTFVVDVMGKGDYDGKVTSDPIYPISGYPIIYNTNARTEQGYEVIKEGTVLEALVYPIDPLDSHNTLSYQWYYMDEGAKVLVGGDSKNLVLTEDLLNREIYVAATGTGSYYGTVYSDPNNPYNTTPNTSNIDGGDPDATPEPGIPEGKRVIKVSPTKDGTIYAIKDDDGNTLGSDVVPVSITGKFEDSDVLTPDADQSKYPGYYAPEAGNTLYFLVDNNKSYDISEITIENKDTLDTAISPPIRKDDISTDYDDNGTTDTKDDKCTIIIDEPLQDIVYAILKLDEESGVYEEVDLKKTSDGIYVPQGGGDKWTDTTVASDGTIKFTDLDPGTYKVEGKPNTEFYEKFSPSDVTAVGSNDIVLEYVPSAQASATPAASSAAPSTSASASPATQIITNNYTEDEISRADEFIKQYVTNPKGNIITKITDSTRDIIVSGESQWKTLTDTEKQLVNEKLKEAGCPYTYDELLKKAKSYKIPGFKVVKFMKKKTKAKVKMIKTKGATVVTTTTNKKIATISKKGVIKAKKKGKARLTIVAVKGKHTNRLVIDLRVKKKFKNAKELKKFKSKVIKTPTILIAKKRKIKKSSKISVYDLLKSSKVKYKVIKKKILKINKKGKYKGKKKGSTLVRVKIKQNNKTYILYVYVTIYKKGKK